MPMEPESLLPIVIGIIGIAFTITLLIVLLKHFKK